MIKLEFKDYLDEIDRLYVILTIQHGNITDYRLLESINNTSGRMGLFDEAANDSTGRINYTSIVLNIEEATTDDYINFGQLLFFIKEYIVQGHNRIGASNRPRGIRHQRRLNSELNRNNRWYIEYLTRYIHLVNVNANYNLLHNSISIGNIPY